MIHYDLLAQFLEVTGKYNLTAEEELALSDHHCLFISRLNNWMDKHGLTHRDLTPQLVTELNLKLQKPDLDALAQEMISHRTP